MDFSILEGIGINAFIIICIIILLFVFAILGFIEYLIDNGKIKKALDE